MGGARVSLAAIVVLMLQLAVSAGFPQEIVGLDIAHFGDREVLVIRTSGDVPAPGAYVADPQSATISFTLRMVGAEDVALPPGGSLISSVDLDTTGPEGVRVTARLAESAMTEPDRFRLSQPGIHLILLEVFPSEDSKEDGELIVDVEEQLGIEDQPAPEPAPKAAPLAEPEKPATLITPATDERLPSEGDSLSVLTVDLTGVSADRALSLAAEAGLLSIDGRAVVSTEQWGQLSVSPGGMSLASWAGSDPPGELYLQGSEKEIAAFLAQADPQALLSEPRFSEYWADHRPGRSSGGRSAGGAAMGGRSDSASRIGLSATSSAASSDRLPGGGKLSDIRVTLPAIPGANLFDVLNYLSKISGISLIVDPYAFDEPFGSRREPLDPGEIDPMPDEPGYRPGNVFDPQIGGSGSVMGNFDNVPFDTALSLILGVHELEYVVYGGTTQTGNYGTGSDPYAKPIILVTSRERLEQELAGTNTISLHQMHYADPDQMTQLLGNFSLLPGTNSGWYIYRGSGGGGGGTGGGGNSGGGGSGGGGIGGGSGSGGGHGAQGSSAPDIIVHRGSTRTPVIAEVRRALDNGENVIRVLLDGDSAGQFTTMFAR